jgi:EmrB/QacA subfamily drug resistance transporter
MPEAGKDQNDCRLRSTGDRYSKAATSLPRASTASAKRDPLFGRKLRVLLCGAGAPFLIMLDTNIVAVSLPSIARELHGDFADVEWVVSAYILPFAALLLPAGALADRLGRRRMLLLGLSVFTFASLLCGLAPSLSVLNAARAMQAVGAALQLTASLAVMAHGFRGRERVRAYAIWGTVMGLAPSLGPTVGGFVTAYLGWRWAFFINLPIGIGLISLAVTSIDESRDPNASRLDLPGIVLFGAGLFAIVWALIDANSVARTSVFALAKFAIGGLLLAIFVFAERLHPRPMIDLSLFRDPVVVGTAVAMLGYAASAQVMMTILPLYLQDAFGQSPLTAGFAILPFALPLLIGPGVGGALATRMSSRMILSFGLGLVALGDAGTAAILMAGLGYWTTAIGLFIIGAGAGLLNSETAKAQISAIPPSRAGMASGIASTTRFVGINLGLAGLGAVLATVFESTLQGLAAPLVSSQVIDWRELTLRLVAGDATGALSSLPVDVHAAIENAVRDSTAAGFGAALAAGAVVAALSGALSWHLMRPETALPAKPQTGP